MIFWNHIAVDYRKDKEVKRILVIGAGASGMMAAIQAAQKGAQVTIYEKSDRVGKKILATGNGKCNLSNEDMEMNNYFCEDYGKLATFFSRFSTEDTIAFFKECGLMIRSRDGYLYPYCEQASVVLDVLRTCLKKYSVKIVTDVTDISLSAKKNGKFLVQSSFERKEFDAVILACGSRAGVKNASTEGYDYAKIFGHRIVPLLPALVQVRCEDNFWASVSGVRCKAEISLYINDKYETGEKGELQLTDYGISGIPVFQISRIIAKALYGKEKVSVNIDFVPDVPMDEWKEFIINRMNLYRGFTLEEFLTGMLHKKISQMLHKHAGLKATDILTKENENTVMELCLEMKCFTVVPQKVNGFEQAQVCSGGVDFTELNENLESVYQPGLYVCGEMVDVDGKCGGYNLQWAWTSGYIAGVSAAE